jgi:hypothetical protein
MLPIIYGYFNKINIFIEIDMALFNINPGQFYSRTPSTNLLQQNYNLVQSVPYGYGNPNNIASIYNNNPSIPGIAAYSLPHQTYYNYGVNNPTLFGTQTLKNSLVKTAVNSALQGLVYGLTGGPSTDPTNGRLGGTGAAQGGTSSDLLAASNSSSNSAWSDDSEDRVIITDQTGQFINASSVLKPLQALGGVLFPYTPQIQVTHRASYDMQNLVHTNYTTPMYQHSQIESINITAQFTANYPAEAEYVIAMIHFFRSVTKMFYGQDQLAGTPPPVLFLDGYGPYTFNHIPVVVTSFDYTLPQDVDYISCTVKGEKQKVPTTLSITLNLMPTYSRNKISNNFGLAGFAKGSLGGGNDGTGGWI